MFFESISINTRLKKKKKNLQFHKKRLLLLKKSWKRSKVLKMFQPGKVVE
jgi:hypothetical protein